MTMGKFLRIGRPHSYNFDIKIQNTACQRMIEIHINHGAANLQNGDIMLPLLAGQRGSIARFEPFPIRYVLLRHAAHIFFRHARRNHSQAAPAR
jgi:hypothetical protein